MNIFCIIYEEYGVNIKYELRRIYQHISLIDIISHFRFSIIKKSFLNHFYYYYNLCYFIVLFLIFLPHRY